MNGNVVAHHGIVLYVMKECLVFWFLGWGRIIINIVPVCDALLVRMCAEK